MQGNLEERKERKSMARHVNIILEDSSSYALRPQIKMGQYDHPFTLNPTTGCTFACKYCYSPAIPPQIYHGDPKREFFETVRVKMDKPELLRKELQRYSGLPQHLKRVQINETSEYYLPQTLRHLKQMNQPDVMLGILEEFRQAWAQGNYWMLHILTKSPLILHHLGTLKQMKHQIQIEVSFATHDDAIARSLEFFTPSVTQRLDLVERLSAEGIFVRVMAMPFYGDAADLDKLMRETFQRGAKAFKNKGLNYYDWNDLIAIKRYDDFLNAAIPRKKGRKDDKEASRIIKSGERVVVAGKERYDVVPMPTLDGNFRAAANWATKENMAKMVRRRMSRIDCGYRDCNAVNWGYII
jgi:DNA repair photolyase